MILYVVDLSLKFDKKEILKHVNFQLQAGEIACLLGASGCGKTTILRSIAGFEQPQQGKITLKERCLFDPKQSIHIAAHQRRIGMVFQDFALFPHLNVANNIAFGIQHLEKNQRQQRVEELLTLIGLTSHAKHFPHELSGGQQQRVALARALAPKPDLLLLDEPFSSLDVHLRQKLTSEVRQLLKQEQVTALLVTHDQEEAFTMSDHIGVLHEGQLQQWATPFELYYHPHNAIVADFIGQGSFIDIEIQQQQPNSLIQPIKYTSANELTSQQQGQFFIRPDDVVMYPQHQSLDQPNTPAVVIQQDFKGQYFLYQLQLSDQQILLAKADVHRHFALGEQINIVIEQAILFT